MSPRPATPFPRTPWARPFHVLVKPIGARCNLACRYCFYLEKEPALFPGDGIMRMTDATLERFTKDYLAAQPGEEVTFAWQGGEPTLMGVEFFRRAVELQRRYAAGRRITNAIQTNGTLLDEAWGEFLAAEHFLVGLSLDGPRQMHDPFRVGRGGEPTWERVLRGLRVLQKHRVEFNTLTVVHRRNARHPREVYRFLRDEGARFMQFIPLVERRASARDAAAGLAHAGPPEPRGGSIAPCDLERALAETCPRPGDFGAFLRGVFDLWVRRDVGRVFVQTFDVALSAWLGLGAPLCVFQERCGRSLALEHNGDVYSCDHYVYAEHRLGNLHATPLADLANGAGAERFGAAKADLPRVCRECPVRFVCHGDCPKHRFVAAGPGEPGVSCLCADYRGFFAHIAPAMERMVALMRAGRPAAEAMKQRGG